MSLRLEVPAFSRDCASTFCWPSEGRWWSMEVWFQKALGCPSQLAFRRCLNLISHSLLTLLTNLLGRCFKTLNSLSVVNFTVNFFMLGVFCWNKTESLFLTTTAHWSTSSSLSWTSIMRFWIGSRQKLAEGKISLAFPRGTLHNQKTLLTDANDDRSSWKPRTILAGFPIFLFIANLGDDQDCSKT